MRTTIFSEIFKVFSNKIFMILLSVFLVLNTFFLYNSQLRGNSVEFVPMSAVMDLSDDVKKYEDDNQKIEFIENKLLSVYENDAVLYTDDSYADRKLLEKEIAKIEIVSDYSSYVESVIDNANVISGISIFADENSFSYKNAVATAQDFRKLLNIKTSYDISNGVNLATNFLLTDIFILVLLFIVSDSIVGVERTINITGLQKSCKYGRGKLAFSKVIVTFILSIIISTLFYGSNYLISGATYTFGNVFRSIQSVEGFENCTLKINVFQFLVLFLVIKIFVVFLLGMLINVITTLSRSKTEGYISFLLILLFSFIVWSVIDDNSRFMSLKYINLLSFFKIKNVIAEYRNINMLSNPVNFFKSFCVFLVVLLLVVVTLYLLIYKYKRIGGYVKYKDRAFAKIKFLPFGNNVFLHEMYKTFIINKVCLIFVAVISLQFLVNFSYPLVLNEQEKYEKYFFSYYSGTFDNGNREKIYNDILTVQNNNQNYSSIVIGDESESDTHDRYSKIQSELNATDVENQKFSEYVIPYYEYLCDEVAVGKSPSVMFYRGYSVFLGVDGSLSNTYCLAVYILISICIVPIFTNEYERKTIPLLASTKKGLKKLFVIKLGCAYFVTLVINMIVYIPFLFRISKVYGFNGLNNTVCSIPDFSIYPARMTILQLIIFVLLVRLFTSLVICTVIAIISNLTKSTVATLIVSMVAFVVPLMLPLNNINLLNDYSLYYMQHFNGLFRM